VKGYERSDTSPRNDVHLEKKAEAIQPKIILLILPEQSINSAQSWREENYSQENC
jgi:hypothetical protein